MAPEKYDLVVIGSGPAGEKGAAQAAYFGKRVALVEKEPVLGGAAANTGTLPSKTLRESALFLSGFRQRGLFGISFTMKEQVTVRDFLAHERLVKENERERIQKNLKRHRVDLYRGTASLADAHTITVQPSRCPGFQIHGDVILIATGSYPYRPAVFPFHNPPRLRFRHHPDAARDPGDHAGGRRRCDRLRIRLHVCRPGSAGDAGGEARRPDQLSRPGDCRIASPADDWHGDAPVNARCCRGGEVRGAARGALESGTELQPQTILVSSGRCGNIDGLGLEKLGIALGTRGSVRVNQHYQTTVPHIYAAGDVIGFPALASTSMEQARLAMVHAFDLKYKDELAPVLPYGIFTIPECSMAGETEEALIEKKVPYVVGKASYASNARGQIIGDSQGLLKLLFHEKDMKLLGVHVIGEQATELVHVGLTALLMNAGADLFIRTCYNYPTLTELYKYATYDALGRQQAQVSPH